VLTEKQTDKRRVDESTWRAPGWLRCRSEVVIQRTSISTVNAYLDDFNNSFSKDTRYIHDNFFCEHPVIFSRDIYEPNCGKMPFLTLSKNLLNIPRFGSRVRWLPKFQYSITSLLYIYTSPVTFLWSNLTLREETDRQTDKRCVIHNVLVLCEPSNSGQPAVMSS